MDTSLLFVYKSLNPWSGCRGTLIAAVPPAWPRLLRLLHRVREDFRVTLRNADEAPSRT